MSINRVTIQHNKDFIMFTFYLSLMAKQKMETELLFRKDFNIPDWNVLSV